MKTYSFFTLSRTLIPIDLPSVSIGLLSPLHGASFSLKGQNPQFWYWSGVMIYFVDIVDAALARKFYNRIHFGLSRLNPNSVVVQSTQVTSFRIMMPSTANGWVNGFELQLSDPSIGIEILVDYDAGYASGDTISCVGQCEFTYKGPTKLRDSIIPPDYVTIKK